MFVDSIQLYKELIVAAKRELIKFRFLAVFISIILFFAIYFIAFNWPQVFRSSAIITLDHTNVIEPLLRGAVGVTDTEVNERVADLMLSRRVIEAAIRKQADKTQQEYSPEQLEKLVRYFRENIMVEVQGNNRAVTHVSFAAESASDAYENLKAIVTVFLEDRVAEKQKDSFEAYNFIDAQVRKYKSQLEEAEINLKHFKENSADVTEFSVKKRIADLSSEVKNLEISIEESIAALKATKTQLEDESRFLSLRTKVVALEARKTTLTEELDRLRLSFQDSYPDIVMIKSQIKEIDAEITAAMSTVKGSTAGDISELPLYEELRKQYSDAQLKLSTQKRRLISMNKLLDEERLLADEVAGNQAELSDLTRDYNVTKKHYEEMLVRKENAKLTMALNNEGQGENYKLAQPPVYPLKPEGINPIIILLAAPIVALLAPVGLALAYVFIDPRIRLASRLRLILPDHVALLAVIPHQGSVLASRLLKKDMLAILFLAIVLAIFYVYSILQLALGFELEWLR